MTEDVLGTYMLTVLACVNDALDAAGTPVGLASLTPGGLPAWDNCCDGGGQLYVRLVQAYPTGGPNAPFPQVDTQQAGCGITSVAVRIGVGVMRCVHTVDDGMNFPAGMDMTADTLAITSDYGVVLDALRCCVVGLPGPYPGAWKLDTWQPQGALGGCGGGEWQFLAQMPVCACPETP